MAENLTLTLFMAGVYLLLIPVTGVTTACAALIAIAFYMTKYASIPLTGFFFLSYLTKIYGDQLTAHKKKKNGKYYFILVLVSLSLFLLYSWWEWATKGSTLLVSLMSALLPHAKIASSSASGVWFSISYVKTYLPSYLRAIAGGVPMHFLWDTTPIVPFYVGLPALFGLGMGLISRKTRLLSSSLIAMLFSSIVFMSTFYSQDMRYLYHAIPTLLIGFYLFWSYLGEEAPRALKYPNLQGYIVGAVSLFFLFYVLINAIRLKSAIMVNVKYAETPWYFISVLELNSYFSKPLQTDEKEPVVISSMIPYYIDFFSNGNYSLLPLSLSQEFRAARSAAWGDFNYTNLLTVYHKVLQAGYPLYVDNYGLGNEQPLHADFMKIQDAFTLTLVHSGCYNVCNIWQLHEKP
jgi:hypothetical protein